MQSSSFCAAVKLTIEVVDFFAFLLVAHDLSRVFFPFYHFIAGINMTQHPATLVTAAYDHVIRFWETKTGRCYRTIQHLDSVSLFKSVTFASLSFLSIPDMKLMLF